MNRLLGTAALLLVVVVALPAIARLAQAAMPALASLVLVLGVLKLVVPPSHRRRR